MPFQSINQKGKRGRLIIDENIIIDENGFLFFLNSRSITNWRQFAMICSFVMRAMIRNVILRLS
jgi:hypothetical protein